MAIVKLSNAMNNNHTKKDIISNEKMDESKIILSTRNLNLYYGEKQALRDINIQIEKNKVTALIGPSGCGKSTLIRCFNRMNDVISIVKIDGAVYYRGNNLLSKNTEITLLRKMIGMIFQKPNPFPMSIYDNIAYGPRLHGQSIKSKLNATVEKCLKMAVLWDEVSGRLNESALSLSGGQQQRLCIARAMAVGPEVILMDEPTSSLDPLATSKIEDLITELKKQFTVIIVTHNMQQAARISDFTGFMYLGELIEFGETPQIFENPSNELTERYITGRFG